MNISAVSYSSTIEESNLKCSMQQWAEIAFAISTIAISVIINAPFAAGTFAGLTGAITTIIIFSPISNFLERKGAIDIDDDEEKKYEELVKKHPLVTGLFGPCVEEGLFRILLQQACQHLAFLAFPIAMPTAKALGICIQAFIFGFVHISNHSEKNINAGLLHFLSAFSMGIVYGALKETAGFSACLAAHVTFNTTLLTIDKIAESPLHSEAGSTEESTV